MSQVVRDANVYFLPPAAAPRTPLVPSRWRRFRASFRGEIWRVRFAIAGLRLALRRPRTSLFDDDAATGALTAPLVGRRPRVSPARVIDFSTARARLRPLPAVR